MAPWLRWRLRRRRILWRRLAARCPLPSLAALYRGIDLKLDEPWTATDFLAVDLEMTGLNPARDAIVSVGFVPVSGGRILLADARHLLIAGRRDVGQSATIHRIRDQDLIEALPLPRALDILFGALEKRILVFHHGVLDISFLDSSCRTIADTPFQLPHADTLQLEKSRLLRRHQPIAPGELRLASCRRRLNLPDASGHNALSDALATAELFLALAAHKGPAGSVALKQLVTL